MTQDDQGPGPDLAKGGTGDPSPGQSGGLGPPAHVLPHLPPAGVSDFDFDFGRNPQSAPQFSPPAGVPTGPGAPKLAPAPAAAPWVVPPGVAGRPGAARRGGRRPGAPGSGPAPGGLTDRRPPGKFSLAGWFSRGGALLIDWLIIVLVDFMIVGVLLHSGRNLILAVGLFFAAFFELYLVGIRGATPGMAYMKIKVVDADTGRYPIGVVKGLIRWGVRILLGLIPLANLFDYLWALWDPHNQTLHDKVARTVVIRSTGVT